jgi:antirestriction protein ArdC
MKALGSAPTPTHGDPSTSRAAKPIAAATGSTSQCHRCARDGRPGRGARSSNGRNGTPRCGRAKRPPTSAFSSDPQAETSTDPQAERTSAIVKWYAVFSADQVDGWTAPAAPSPDSIVPAVSRADDFIAATGARITNAGEKAFYRQSTDEIVIPPRELFIGTETSTPQEAYYSTVLHELTHWTSAENRCNRQLGKRFGDEAYAMEELVAELGAAFLCADLGIADTPRADHAQYLDNWLRVLKADKKAIFTAASKASQAAGFLASLQAR